MGARGMGGRVLREIWEREGVWVEESVQQVHERVMEGGWDRGAWSIEEGDGIGQKRIMYRW